MKILSKILVLLPPSEKKKLLILILLFLISSLLDVLGIASILPFITILTNPDLISTNNYLNSIYEYSSNFGVSSLRDFLFLFGIFVFLILVVSLLIKTLTAYAMSYYVKNLEYKISERLLEHYLAQSYSWSISRNSSNLQKSILSDVTIIIDKLISPLIVLISQCTNSIFIVGLLIFVDVELAFYITITFVTIYLSIFNFFKLNVKKNSLKYDKSNALRFKILTETFGSIKYLKASNLENYFLKLFSSNVKPYYLSQASSSFISQAPKFGIEAISFGGMLIIVLYLMFKFNNFLDVMPYIAMYAFAGYRLLPSFQQIYSSLNEFILSKPMFDNLSYEMNNLKKLEFTCNNNKIYLNDSIKLNQVSFTYPNRSSPALKNINITLKASSLIGIVGPTGSGKTTFIDLLLFLLEPQEGYIEIDKKILKDNKIKSWQKSIGYVPQNVYLTDSSIYSNIAFGVVNDEIDKELVEKVSEIAQVNEFIDQLPDKYSTNVGDQGLNLSGGQRQRIGIARALYNNPKILILDEATSALDNITEKKVMDALLKNKIDMTTIVITHRLNSLKKCDQIIMIDKGEIAYEGNYDILKETSKFF